MDARPAPNLDSETGAIDGSAEGEASTRDLKSALLKAENALRDFAPDLPISFHFGWQGRLVHCGIDRPEDSAVLRVCVDLGPLPFTAEQPERRLQLIDAAYRSRSNLGQIVLTPSQRFEYRLDLLLDSPLHGKAIVTAVTHALLCGARSAAASFA